MKFYKIVRVRKSLTYLDRPPTVGYLMKGRSYEDCEAFLADMAARPECTWAADIVVRTTRDSVNVYRMIPADTTEEK